uniref:Uncharacterized protein n=1 Tax=Cacopsylla melanoneura TaxID=428564 RepID=A0A8D8MCC0_9HEMI
MFGSHHSESEARTAGVAFFLFLGAGFTFTSSSSDELSLGDSDEISTTLLLVACRPDRLVLVEDLLLDEPLLPPDDLLFVLRPRLLLEPPVRPLLFVLGDSLLSPPSSSRANKLE